MSAKIASAAPAEPLPDEKGGHLLVAMFACLSFLVELAILEGIVAGRLPPAAGGGLHLAYVALAGLYVMRRSRRDRRALPSLALLVLVVAVTGPVGAAGALLTLFLHAVIWRAAPKFKEWYYDLFPEEEDAEDQAIEMRLRQIRASDDESGGVAPFMAVLSFGSREQMQQAVALMTRRFTPAFAPALKIGLNHNENVVRVQSATAVRTIEDALVEKAGELERAAAERPGDRVALLALARHHDEYSLTGLFEPQRERESRDKALEVYSRYLELEPEDAQARLAVGRLLSRAGRDALAAEWFELCLRSGCTDEAMLPWYMENLFRLGRLSDVRRVARENAAALTRLDRYPMRIVETVRLWGAVPAGEAA